MPPQPRLPAMSGRRRPRPCRAASPRPGGTRRRPRGRLPRAPCPQDDLPRPAAAASPAPPGPTTARAQARRRHRSRPGGRDRRPQLGAILVDAGRAEPRRPRRRDRAPAPRRGAVRRHPARPRHGHRGGISTAAWRSNTDAVVADLAAEPPDTRLIDALGAETLHPPRRRAVEARRRRDGGDLLAARGVPRSRPLAARGASGRCASPWRRNATSSRP